MLESLPATEGPTKVHAAVKLARRILRDESRGKICVLTDACFDAAAELAAAEDVEMIRVGQRTGNVAITRLQARRSIAQPRTCQVLAEVSNYCDEPAECRLEVELDGKPVPVILAGNSVDRISIKLAKDGDQEDRWQRVFEIDAPEAGELTLRLDRNDAYPNDNEAAIRVPPTGDLPAGPAADAELLAVDGGGRSESDLRSPADGGTEVTEPVAGRPRPVPWLYLAGVGVVLLALEWCLYQRQWTY